MPPPGYSCSLEKPLGLSGKDERAVLRQQVVDMRWHRAEALEIWHALLQKKLSPDKFVEDQAQDQIKDLAKAAVGVDGKREELKELSRELLKLAKEGAKTTPVRGKLASRIRRFLQVSELKGKPRHRALRKLKRDIKGFRSEHLKPSTHLKKIGKGIAVDLFLQRSRDFILDTGKRQLDIAQSPGEANAALFLIGDALILDAWEKLGDIRLWNAHSFWRGVYSDLSKAHRDGKLNSASAVWDAWSRAVTKEDPEDGPALQEAPVTNHLTDAKIRESNLLLGVRP